MTKTIAVEASWTASGSCAISQASGLAEAASNSSVERGIAAPNRIATEKLHHPAEKHLAGRAASGIATP